MRIQCDIQKICEFYDKFPQHIGKVSVQTPYGPKRILAAKKVEENSVTYFIKTKDYSLTGSPNHKIFTNGRFEFIKNIVVGQFIETIDGQQQVIKSKYLDKKEDLYDIQVEDVEQYYSNGILSHNSSFFEAITFGLFGRTNRSVTKDRIINWKNRKDCQVEVTFKVGRDTFKVRRGIKPDYLEIYKNSKIIVQPPDVRQYQKILENEILKIDYHLFCTLVYVNLNNYTPFIQMDSTRKRFFVEKMFGLEMFSELNKLSNEKLALIENKLAVHNTEKAIKDNLKSDLQTRLQELSLQLVGIKSSQGELDTILKQLEERVNPENEYNSAVNLFNTLNADCISASNKITEIGNNIQFFQKEKTKIEEQVEKKKGEISGHKKNKKKYLDIIKSFEGVDKKLEKEREKKSGLQKKIDGLVGKIHEKELKLAEKNVHYTQLTKSMNDLSGKKVCPLCNSKIDKNLLPNLQGDLEEHQKELETIKESIEQKYSSLNELKGNLETCEKSIKSLLLNSKEYDDAISKLENIDSIIKAIDVESDTENISSLENKIKTSKELLENYERGHKKAEKQKDKQKLMVDKEKEKLDKYNDLKSKKATLEERIIWEDDTKKELKRQIKENNKKLDQLEIELKELDDLCKQLTSLSDYLNYIKVVCKDENAKQYAISFIMPYLTRQINHYLAKAEINYYLNLNNIMDEEIKGPGVYNAGYGNLSGGESKSIDLAILFALLDVSKLQLGVYPDLLLLDELLDTSVDKVGLDNLLKIIMQRQIDDGSKVFIVTHRNDLGDLNGMKQYDITKEDGFSTISEISN